MFEYYSGNIKMRNVNYCYLSINILSYSVVFIKKINLLRLPHWHWCFHGKFMNFSEAATGGVLIKKAVLKIFGKIHRKVAGLQSFNKETPTQMFSSEYCDIFKNTYFEGHLLKAVSDFLKQLQNSGQQLLLYWLLI